MLSWKSALVNEERGLVMRVQEGGPRRNASSAKQSRSSKVWSAIYGNISRDFIDKDTHHEGTGQRETMKYLRESCCHRIKCFVANSLIVLMRKWYLNSNFSTLQLLQKTLGMCWWNKDQHQWSNLHVEGEDEGKKIV